MKMKPKSRSPRHFPYKHPTFGTKNRPKSPKASVYYWWWEYLRRNKKYLKPCDAGGRGPMAGLYKDFGDVRGDDFKAWWTEDDRGARLFAELPAEESVRVLKEGEKVPETNQTLTVSFPLNLPKKLLENRFKQLLRERHTGKRGHQLAKKSQARYRFRGQPNIAALELDLKIYDLRESNPNPKMKLWEIGKETLNPEAKYMLKPTDNPHDKVDKKMKLAIIVRRHLKKAEDRIKHVGEGKFL